MDPPESVPVKCNNYNLTKVRMAQYCLDGVSFARLMTTRTAVERMVSITVVQKRYRWP